MREVTKSTVDALHPDYEVLSEIAEDLALRIGKRPEYAFAEKVLEAIEFVLDPVRTGRTSLAQLDPVEKTFIGLKVEHFVRDLLDAPKGVRDLRVAGHDVDIKNTVGQSWGWMIPPETYRTEEPVLLIAADEVERRAWMGLMLARDSYLAKPNRDKKRGIRVSAYPHILWLARGLDWPPNRWAQFDMARFRELRAVKGGSKRAAAFFQENLRKVTHRRVLEALLFDQKDPMKRLRENKGAPDILNPLGIKLLSGKFNAPLLSTLGFVVGPDEFVAIQPLSPEEAKSLRRARPETE
jgi:hypothetical protein